MRSHGARPSLCPSFPSGTQVSIHTPVRGVTLIASVPFHLTDSFNPHTRAGCDLSLKYSAALAGSVSIHTPVQGVASDWDGVDGQQRVSIHTPVRGVTPACGRQIIECSCFNPHTRAGCDPDQQVKRPVGKRFNPHTRAGCDESHNKLIKFITCFNPHTRAGCDISSKYLFRVSILFQSTHPCGV